MLPPALPTTSLVTLVFRSRRARGPDCVGRRAQIVGCHVTHRSGLPGCMSRFFGGALHLPGRRIGGKGGHASLSPRDLTPRPGAPQLDGPARTIVPRFRLLEEMQHVLRTISRPHGKKMMISILESAAATHRGQPGVPDFGQNDLSTPSSLGTSLTPSCGRLWMPTAFVA